MKITDWNGAHFQGDPDAAFWRCPQTGRDCRQSSRPTLGVIYDHHDREQPVDIRMFWNPTAADSASEYTAEVFPSELGHFVRACSHIAEKAWMAPHCDKLFIAVQLIVGQFFQGVP